MEGSVNKIIITEPVLGDERAIAFIQKQTWLETYPNQEHNITKADVLLKDFDSQEKLEKWQKVIKENGSGDFYFCIAKDGDKIIGYCQTAKGQDYNELKMLYILPEYQRRGVGKKLSDKAINWLGQEKEIILEVASYNQKAINFYEKYGFVKIGAGKSVEFPNGKKIPTIRLKLAKLK